MAPDIAAVVRSDPKMLATTRTTVLAVVNQKGGVGKTTTAINLGTALAELGHPVLLIDLDPQANSTSGLGLDPARVRGTIYQLLGGDASVDEVMVETAVPLLSLVPSHIDLAGAEIELASLDERETRLSKAIASVPDAIECVIIDCPPSLGLLTLNALTAATSMLIPTQCEYFALEGLRHLLYTHQLVRSRLASAGPFALRRRAIGRAGRIDTPARRAAAAPRPQKHRRLRADRGRETMACRSARGPQLGACGRAQRHRQRRAAGARLDREPPACRPRPDRRSSRAQTPQRRVQPHS